MSLVGLVNTNIAAEVAVESLSVAQSQPAGSDQEFVKAAISSSSEKIAAPNVGLGALVDANLSQESAQLRALQIRQQLGTQGLSLTNQAPQSLLSLFK